MHNFLGHIEITEQHTGGNIRDSVLTLLRSYKTVLGGKTVDLTHYLHSSTTDNAKNVINANKLMEIVYIGCKAHKINLAMKRAVGGKFPRSGHPDYTKDPWKDN